MNVLFTREVWLTRIIGHDHHFLLANAVAANELIEINELLQSHAKRAGGVILRPEFLDRINP